MKHNRRISKDHPYHIYNEDGISQWSPYIDENDKPVKRTPQTHPYSYDGYVKWRGGNNKQITGTVYSDRLMQWDSAKCEELAKKYMHPHTMADKEPKLIEKFLQEYNNEPALKLILIMEYCNASSGYPVWRYDYSIPKTTTNDVDTQANT